MKPMRDVGEDDRYAFLAQCSPERVASKNSLPFQTTPVGKGNPQAQTYAGGRDVRYGVVSVADRGISAEQRRVAISYGPSIAGTDLIYDLTGEFLQGKARPFECDLTQHSQRVYAVLPFQLERIAIAAPRRALAGKMLAVRVEFQQATGDRIQGVLPFHLKLLRPDGAAEHQSWRRTDRDGRFGDALLISADGSRGQWSLVVRSQLSGEEATAAIEL